MSAHCILFLLCLPSPHRIKQAQPDEALLGPNVLTGKQHWRKRKKNTASCVRTRGVTIQSNNLTAINHSLIDLFFYYHTFQSFNLYANEMIKSAIIQYMQLKPYTALKIFFFFFFLRL